MQLWNAFSSAMRHAGSDSRPEPKDAVTRLDGCKCIGVPMGPLGVYHTRDSCGTHPALLGIQALPQYGSDLTTAHQLVSQHR